MFWRLRSALYEYLTLAEGVPRFIRTRRFFWRFAERAE